MGSRVGDVGGECGEYCGLRAAALATVEGGRRRSVGVLRNAVECRIGITTSSRVLLGEFGLEPDSG
jgi:hypothetical protein